MTRHIVYAHPGAFPSDAANTVNVAKMCAAFAGHGSRVTLVGIRTAHPAAGDVAGFYHLSHPIRTLGVPARLRGGRTFAWVSALIARLLGADLVMTRMPRIGWAAARLGLPVILELHADLDWVGPQRPALEALSRSGRLAGLVVISEALARHYEEAMPHVADRIIVAHDGADAVESPVEPRALGADDRLRVGYVGHLYPGKGMEIIAEVAPLCPWADFEIVGGRPDDVAAWRGRAAHISNLRFHGAVPHAEVNDWLARFDVVLAPYLREVIVSDGRTDVAKWMSPLKIFEYMAAGKAIVTSDLPVLREVLEDGETALLCDPDHAGYWVDALKRLRSDNSLIQRLGGSARQTFEAHYTWSSRAKAILARALPGDAKPR